VTIHITDLTFTQKHFTKILNRKYFCWILDTRRDHGSSHTR